ncbi:MAG: hypothetical protein L0Y54_06520 [Sporichthyaceae bacterium]|nr:hypothetical protein [Sporichthyaceae bacterium]
MAGVVVWALTDEPDPAEITANGTVLVTDGADPRVRVLFSDAVVDGPVALIQLSRTADRTAGAHYEIVLRAWEDWEISSVLAADEQRRDVSLGSDQTTEEVSRRIAELGHPDLPPQDLAISVAMDSAGELTVVVQPLDVERPRMSTQPWRAWLAVVEDEDILTMMEVPLTELSVPGT